MNILVTGAAGFLGYHLARKLSDSSAGIVYCADNFIRGEDDALYRELAARPNVRRVDCDLNDPAALAAIPEAMDYVYHMAALNGTQNFYERPFDVVRCCTLPTMNLLEKYGRAGLTRFVYAGTSEAYASTVSQFDWPVPTDETVPLSFNNIFNARWSYGASKMHGEIATANAGAQFKMPYSIVRFHNAYGPRMGDKHVIPDFLGRATKGVFELYGHAETRSFIYVDDAVAATIAVATSPMTLNTVINVGGQEEMTMRALAQHLMRICGFEGEITLHPAPEGSVKRRAPKLDRLFALTDYREQWRRDDGLRKTAEFYLGRDIKA